MIDMTSCSETLTESITFRWELPDMKRIFESNQGAAKTRFIKSPEFGGGRWKIGFNPSSTTDKGYVSLFLFCEPTSEEKDRALDGKWTRDGTYKFNFKISISSGNSFAVCAEKGGQFTFSYQNWYSGWSRFAQRDAIYFDAPENSRKAERLMITCVIESVVVSNSAFSAKRRHVPKSLTEAVGLLLDDPDYSDVEFIFPPRGLRKVKNIWAAKVLLEWIDYFDFMFNGGFSESFSRDNDDDQSDSAYESASEMPWRIDPFEDSDAEDDVLLCDDSEDEALSDEEESQNNVSKPSVAIAVPLPNSPTSASHQGGTKEGTRNTGEDIGTELGRHAKVRILSSLAPQAVDQAAPEHSEKEEGQQIASESGNDDGAQARKIFTVRVDDAPYNTYHAVLYYIYTDNILLAPLSSSFISETEARGNGDDKPSASSQNLPDNQGGGERSARSPEQAASCAAARREWIKRWTSEHPDLPAPCSAKAAYRLADKLDLTDLKQRAKKHIINQLTVTNIAYEVFSPFAAAFEDIRKIEVEFFLNHWEEIRTSSLMHSMWEQVRTGRHPGFEGAWPIIAKHLVFIPATEPAETP